VRGSEGEVTISPAPAPAPRWTPEGPFVATTPSEDRTRPGRRILRIYPYAVSRNRLERAIREMHVPAYIAESLGEADLVLTLKSQEKRQPKRLQDAAMRGTPLHVLRSNTVSQIQAFLREVFEVEEGPTEHENALTEVEEAIAEVFDSARPVELAPQNSYIRRLQHQLVQRYGLASESKGDEPFRRVVIYPK
jgi:predicted RNA-binding protein Jag